MPRDLLRFGKAYWFLLVLCVLWYAVILAFRSTFSIKYFQHAHGLTLATAGAMNSFVFLAAMFATPAFGWLCDRIGRYASLLAFGALLLPLAIIIMTATDWSLWIASVLLGISYSLVPAVMWPLLSRLVPPAQFGTALGLMWVVQNAGIAGANLVAGRLNDVAGASAANPSQLNRRLPWSKHPMKPKVPPAMMLVLALFANPLAATPTTQSLEASVERAAKTFEVPGIAVSVVHDGKDFYADGHGVLEVGSTVPASDRTLFQIGSLSKAFTAAALAILVDEGKLKWDDPVIDYLPEFRMHDPWVTREFTIRDLLTHRSGLPPGAGDLLMFPDGKATPADVIRALRYLKPASSFRSQFAYDNQLYIVAGEVLARVTNMPFQAFLEQRLLAPLGMSGCVASADRAAPAAERATAHMFVDGKLVSTSTRVTPLVAAAGGVTCDARGMANWMSFMLNGGASREGKRLVSEEQFGQLTRPVTLLDTPGYLSEHAGAYLNAYALGWNVSTFYGQPMLSHSGGVWGMTSFIAVLPKQGLAVFASGNQMSAAPTAVVYDIVDQFLQDSAPGAGKDWIALLDKAVQQRRSAASEAVDKAWEARNAKSKPSLPLAAYTGTYRDTWYGEVRVSLAKDGQLEFRSDRNEPLQGPLEHFQYDTFIARWTDRRLMADAYVTFLLGAGGTIEGMRMKAVSPTTDFSYDFHDLDLKRVPPAPPASVATP